MGVHLYSVFPVYSRLSRVWDVDVPPRATIRLGTNRTVKIRIIVSTSVLNASAHRGATAGMKMKHIPIPTLRRQCIPFAGRPYSFNLRE